MELESQGRETVEQFFKALWGEAQGFTELRLISSTSGVKSSYFKIPEMIPAMAEAAIAASGKYDVYYTVCLVKEDLGARASAKADAGIATCFWTDVDLYRKRTEDGKKLYVPKYDLPYPDLQAKVKSEIKQLTEAVPLSMVTWSGAGWHLYWFLKEPWALNNPGEKGKQETTDLVLEAINRAIAERVGGECWNIGRILRVPFTRNLKGCRPGQLPSDPEARVVLLDPERRYDRSDFERVLDISASMAESGSSAQLPDIEIPAFTEPVDVESLDIGNILKRVIREGLPAYIEFRKATDKPEQFAKRQKDNGLTRSNVDSWCLSLLLAKKFTESQIYAIWRDPKNRVGEKYRERRDGDKYLGWTIRETQTYLQKHPRTPVTNLADRIEAAVSRKFDDDKFEVLKVVKIAFKPPLYEVYTRTPETGEQNKTACNLEAATSYFKFRSAFFEAHNHFPPNIKQETWESKLNGLSFEIQNVEAEVASQNGEISAALEDFVSSAQPISKSAGASIAYLPIRDDETGIVYLNISAFMQYLSGQKIEAKRRGVVEALRGLGYSPDVKRFGTVTSRVWSRLLTSQQNGVANGELDAEKM